MKILILENIISPYKTLLFNAISLILVGFKVLYISETERRRDWVINKDEMKFPYEIMFQVPIDEIPRWVMFKETWKQLNNLNPEVLIIDGYSYSSSWSSLFWARKSKRKLILWSSSNEDDHNRSFYKELLKRYFVKRCDAYNVYGTKSKEYLLKLGAEKDKVFIMGNNTDNTFYYTETMKWKRKREVLLQEYRAPKFNFLYIGRFAIEKNIFHLLDAFRRVREKSNNWGLILVGSGPQEPEIKNYIKKNKVENVLMPGFKQREELPKFLALGDVFILPSISETWGLVVNEAMAAALPVFVSKKCGCWPDLVEDGENGFSFSPFDRDDLFNLMKAAVEGKVELNGMGQASLARIGQYTPESAANVVLKTVNFVLTRRGENGLLHSL